MGRTKGSKTLTKVLFSSCRLLQKAGDTEEQIRDKLGLSPAQQRRSLTIGTEAGWDRLQGAGKLQRRAKRTTAKLAMKQDIIRKRTEAKNLREAPQVTIGVQEWQALRESLDTLTATVLEQHQRIQALEGPDNRLERSIASLPDDVIGSVEDIYALHPDYDFLIADPQHNKPRRKWFGRSK